MSSSDRVRTDTSAPAGASTPASGAPGAAQGSVQGPMPGSMQGPAEPYSRWLERMQRSRTRHAAISKNLYTWSSYKSWADKVKHSFDDEDGKK